MREGYKRFSANLEKASGDITNEQHHYIEYILPLSAIHEIFRSYHKPLGKNGPNR